MRSKTKGLWSVEHQSVRDDFVFEFDHILKLVRRSEEGKIKENLGGECHVKHFVADLLC